MHKSNLCYTYARYIKSVSTVPPAYYAHLAAFRVRYYVEEEMSNNGSAVSHFQPSFLLRSFSDQAIGHWLLLLVLLFPHFQENPQTAAGVSLLPSPVLHSDIKLAIRTG
ncbi:hypothetical protein V6N11_083416 [Hibiscus sabdariffa]|uniref:Piwi domain-containing protein n=1 Tax=Hibiscus sabdariffa TaxID=183260 RepID=A0ABR2QLS8_9ROSI